FQPERFAPDAQADRPRYAYFPFGGGPRLCIGEPFAWMEGELLLASVWQRYSLTLAEGARIEPEPLITLRLKHGLPVMAARR
ncbi:MAG: cytochrome P450, partial [Anaerolineae bacterium]|nr:cytochrome P450 [Anaerolineae bacterium]